MLGPCLLAAAAALCFAGAAHAQSQTYFSEIILSNSMGGSPLVLDRQFSNDPIASQRTSVIPGLTAQTGVDLGVLRASASVPDWNGSTSNYNQALAAVSYRDTMSFTQQGGGWIPVRFDFAFDGTITGDPAGGGGGVSVGMDVVLWGAQGTMAGTQTTEQYYLDGAPNTFGLTPAQFELFFGFEPCGNSPGGYRCMGSSNFSYSTAGDQTGVASFTFLVQSGQSFNVQSSFDVNVSSAVYAPAGSSFDFSHTARLAGIYAPDGTSITSQFGDSFVVAGGVGNYAANMVTPVPEPSTYALMLVGLGIAVGVARRRKPSSRNAQA